MKFERSSGILLHPTSLPGRYGIGDIGPQAHGWIDFLAGAGCTLWQVLPLSPTGYGDSPYQSFSAFAGNPYLISPEFLLQSGLLHSDDLANHPHFPQDRVDYGAVIHWKLDLLNRSYQRFLETASTELQEEHRKFRDTHSYWLPDFALFMALKDAHGGAPWPSWEPALRDRNPDALTEAREKHTGEIERQVYRQFIFFRQWSRLRTHAEERRIQIIGDIPIFVAHDSADVWANRGLFYIDQEGNPEVVAGVPPDYFSPTGQLWGNPLYKWRVHRENGYTWWLERLQAVLELVHIVRVDHFRGFSGYWEIPAGMPTAEKGRWVRGPGKDFFRVVKEELGELPIIAEDLGVITPDVVDLRDSFNLPGMKILQFAFSGNPNEKFLPHNYPRNCVAYTGTHDNDTTWGWFRSAPEHERLFCLRYLGRDGHDIVWSMIRRLWSSVAVYTLAPMQDFLDLGTEARMNYPGRPSGNWTWRMPPDALAEQLRGRLADLNFIYLRSPAAHKYGATEPPETVEYEEPDTPPKRKKETTEEAS